MEEGRIREGDFVFINGGGSKRITEVKKDVRLRLGRSGTALVDSLVGMRYGEVVHLDHGAKKFVACDAYPDLDVSDVSDGAAAAAEVSEMDNRNLIDDNQSQLLSNDEIAAIRMEKGVDALLSELVENSTTFHTKTVFSKEKYLKKKQKKYGTLFKVERVTPDNMGEVHLPTVNPSDNQPEEARSLRLRADTIGLILHHSDVHDGSRVLTYDRTNGLLQAYLLTRLGERGRVFHVLDKQGQPNIFPARQLGLPAVRERWSAVPRNSGFLAGVEEPPREPRTLSDGALRTRNPDGQSLWLKGLDARAQLQEQPADSLIIVDDEHPERAIEDLLPFLADGGHVVLYSPFLEDLTGLFLTLRSSCVNIRISETWYRHHQVLPQRTHPTVNMSTAAGYLLTAIKVGANPSTKPRTDPPITVMAATASADSIVASTAEKRPREEGAAADNAAEPPAREAKAEE